MPTSTVKKIKKSVQPTNQSVTSIPQPKAPEPRSHVSLWWCEACKDGKDLTPEQMTIHLFDVHGINICRTPYTKAHLTTHKENGRLVETYEMVVNGKIVLTNEQTFFPKLKVKEL